MIKGTIMLTKFEDDLRRGKVGERIFVEDFLKFLGFKYEDVSDRQSFRIEGADFLLPTGLVDVKANYKDDKKIIIEDWANILTEKKGWFYTSSAKLFIFISTKTRTMIILPNTGELHHWYESSKDNYELKKNKVSVDRRGNRWQSAFRIVPIKDIPMGVAIYKLQRI
ncbi:MAG: hypothetical protein H8D67_12205 [Deltaproteobacteria bacterium]|nr:hypothetical protein [Deltaproteobacteria bacterium]MBL7075020.1 hypothetical protein [candidate division KSB1 bacterium]